MRRLEGGRKVRRERRRRKVRREGAGEGRNGRGEMGN